MDLIEIWRIAQVVLGIGLVIFVHESGHFMAARWCKVRVDVFSLGFGPTLFSWKRGDTTYQVALVPLGGYVKMAGEEPEGEATGPDSGDLRSKSVGQRFFIFSGGVIMNVVFGLVVFPILYWVGIPFTQPLMGPPTAGGPAWEAGLESGTRILEVNGERVITFSEILNEVALGDPTDCELLIQRPGEEASERITIEPRRSPTRGLFELGIRPALDPDRKVHVEEDSAAERAGVQTGDRWIAIAGAAPGSTPEEAFAVQASEGNAFEATFISAATGESYTTTIAPESSTEDSPHLIGVIPVSNQVLALRGEARTRAQVRVGDRIQSINGRVILSHGDIDSGSGASVGTGALLLLRDGVEHALTDSVDAHVLADEIALTAAADERRVRVVPRSAAAAAGMQSGDEIIMVDAVSIDGTETLLTALRAATEDERPATIVVLREVPTGLQELTLTVTSAPVPRFHYGLSLDRAEYIYRETKPLDALLMGGGACIKFLEDSWLTLQGIITDRVPGKNVGGPIAIGVIAHSFASVSWTKLFFFLCVLSMNLAFLNVLPIPLLDGGHLFFLLIEKIKGSPVSDRVMGYSQLAGLVMIGFIFVYILYHDIQRTIGG